MKAKKKKALASSAREGLFSTKLGITEENIVFDFCEETGMHPAHVIRGLVCLGIQYLGGYDEEEHGYVVTKAGALNKKAA